jgi:hypothetical protein
VRWNQGRGNLSYVKNGAIALTAATGLALRYSYWQSVKDSYCSTRYILLKQKLTNRILCAGLAAIIVVGPVFANDLRELPLEQKVRNSTLVVFGRVVKTKDVIDARGNEYARIHLEKILKGKTSKSSDVEVLYQSTVAELDPDSCMSGELYLFFLELLPSGYYRSVNGRFGIYRVGDN